MRKQLQRQLKEKYEILYPVVIKEKRYNEPFSDFGYECGDGWYNLIDELLSWLKFQHLTNQYPKITITQVKEKFGYLSFYYNNPEFDDMIWADWQLELPIEKLKSEFENQISKIRGAVSFASSISNTICENCGSNHEVARNNGNWINYYCKECRLAYDFKKVKEKEEHEKTQ
jgi:hypothetical protein